MKKEYMSRGDLLLYRVCLMAPLVGIATILLKLLCKQ
jgi:hypothetical protein